MNKCKLPHVAVEPPRADASFELEAAQQTQTLRSLVGDLLKSNQELRETNQQLCATNQELHAALLEANHTPQPGD